MNAQALFRLLVIGGALLGTTRCAGSMDTSRSGGTSSPSTAQVLSDGGVEPDAGTEPGVGGAGGGVAGGGGVHGW